MSDNKVDPKITDRSAKEFSKSIESGELYEELKKKDSANNDEKETKDSNRRKSK